MSCPTKSELLDLIAGEIEGTTRRSVVEHVKSCSACALLYCALRLDADASVDELPPAHVYAKLRRRVEETFAPSPRPGLLAMARRPVPAYGLVAAAVLGMMLWSLRPLSDGHAQGHRNERPDAGTDVERSVTTTHGYDAVARIDPDPGIL